MPSNAADAGVFVYTRAGGVEVLDDVVRVRVDPSVTSLQSSSPTHSGGLMIMPFRVFFDVLFVFTMALKALE
jgi:hypothetical protein